MNMNNVVCEYDGVLVMQGSYAAELREKRNLKDQSGKIYLKVFEQHIRAHARIEAQEESLGI